MSAQTWQALSALYDEAADLPRAQRQAWLERLARHPLRGRLATMLGALNAVETGDFLEALPRLAEPEASPPPGAEAGASAGQRVGPYRLERPLGSGGTSEVWLARHDDGRLKRAVALKLLHRWRAGAAFAPRFERERDILAALNHPHIAALHDAGSADNGQPWLALEWVDGEPLTAHADRQGLDLRHRIALFRQVLLAVQHAHANLVLHRDLKPGNILVTADGTVKLLDFGIAKLLAEPQAATHATELTRVAGRPLTPAYASPEQLRGEPLTTASDVYALGVVLYELLAGAPPYEVDAGAPGALERAIVETDPRPPSQRVAKPKRKALAGELDAVVLKALAKPPAQRYSSVDALLADIDRWLAGEPVLARRPSNWLRWRKFVQRHRLGVGLGTAAVAGLIAITAVAVLQGQRARAESALALATRDFLLDLFKRADPDQAAGKEISARELLAGARERIGATLQAQPGLQADLLGSLGRLHAFMGDYNEADRSWASVTDVLSRRSDREAYALALVEHADVVWKLGDNARAARLLDQAAGAAPRPDSGALRARLAAVRGVVKRLAGDREGAAALFATAQQEAEAAFGPDSGDVIEVLRERASLEGASGHAQAARALIAEAIARAGRNAGSLPRDLAGMEYERASFEMTAGAYARAAAALAASGPHCDEVLGPRSETCLVMWQLAAINALKRGDTAYAMSLLPRLKVMIEARDSPRWQAQAVVVAARVLGAAGVLAKHPDVREPLRRLALAGDELRLRETLKRRAQLAEAEAALVGGHAEEAQRWLEIAWQREQQQPLREEADWKPKLLLLSGQLARQQGRLQEALDRTAEAEQLIAARYGAQHPAVLLYRLNRVAPLSALGRHDEGRSVLDDALLPLREALGADAPLWRRLERWREAISHGAAADAGPAATEFFF